MPTRNCDCCGQEFEANYSKTCVQCYEALGLIPEEVKWMLERIIKKRIEPLEKCTCQDMGNGFVASDGRCRQHNRTK